MPADRSDVAIRAFVKRGRPESFTALAAEIAAEFGSERAWPLDLVKDVFRELHKGPRSRYEEDGELIAFIADRADLVSLDRMIALGAPLFGADRFPSRSQLYRLVLKARHGGDRHP